MFWRTGVGRQRAWVVLAVVLALGGTATWYWWPPDDAPPAAPRNSGSTAPVDPRLQAAARWPNVHPDVKYVGDQICAGCHGEIARTYRQHPMGRSLSPIQAASAVERLDADAHNPFTAGAFRYEVERQGARLIHRETATDVKGNVLFQREAPIAFAVGSARRGRSYLIQEDGFLLQSPITWYPQK